MNDFTCNFERQFEILRLLSSSFRFLLSKTVWKRVVGFMRITTVFPILRFTLFIRISVLCKTSLGHWFISFRGCTLIFNFWCYINFSSGKSRLPFLFNRKVFSINRLNWCMKWNGRFHRSRCVFDLPFISKLLQLYCKSLSENFITLDVNGCSMFSAPDFSS